MILITPPLPSPEAPARPVFSFALDYSPPLEPLISLQLYAKSRFSGHQIHAPGIKSMLRASNPYSQASNPCSRASNPCTPGIKSMLRASNPCSRTSNPCSKHQIHPPGIKSMLQSSNSCSPGMQCMLRASNPCSRASNPCSGHQIHAPGIKSMLRVPHSSGHHYSTLTYFLTTADSAQFCLLCCQPEPIPGSLSARLSLFAH